MQINTAKHGKKAIADEDFVTPHVAWLLANERMFGGKTHLNPPGILPLGILWPSGHVIGHVTCAPYF